MASTGEAWIGLDVGTTSSKAVVHDAAGQVVATGRRPTVWTEPGEPGRSELDPHRLLGQAIAALVEAAEATPGSLRIAGIGITSMGETGVLVDAGGRVVAPAIAWHDTRDAVEVVELGAEIGADRFGRTAGKPLRGQFSLTKHRWLTRHETGVADAVRRFNIAEWIVRGLGAGEFCDRALACRTGWFDIAGNAWWAEALEWSGTSSALMPDLVDPGTAVGRVGDLHPRLAGAVVTTAGHDHQAAALGVGATGAGDELDSSGTAEALVRTVLPILTPEQLRTLAVNGVTTDVSIQPGHWSLLGGTEGGLTMQRALERFGVSRGDLPRLDVEALATAAGAVATVRIGSSATVLQQGSVLEQGSALHPDAQAALWRAVVEAATGEALGLHETISDVTGPHNRLIAAGGWCNSAMVVDAKRRAFPGLLISEVAEAGALGAATLAARAAGAIGPDDVLGGTR